MPEFDTDKPRRRTKAFGVLLAGLVATGSLALVAITQEPKQAVSSPAPVQASIVPQIADAKSAAEITFRGKSFAVLKRSVATPFSGEITSIEVKEGQIVKEEDRLAAYKLDRQSMMEVHSILYPERVLGLQNQVQDMELSLKKLKQSVLPIKRLELERVQKELADLKELYGKGMAQKEGVKNKERDLERVEKQILETQDSIRQAESNLVKGKEDLNFYKDKQKRDQEYLEWRTKRSYNNSKLPLNVAYLTAPISGQVIWMSPELRVDAEPPRGFHAITIAPMDPIAVRCKVHELDLVKLKSGDKGTAMFDAIPEKQFHCKISRIPWVSRNPALEVPADYDIECLLENPSGQIKDGLTCNVKMSVTQ
jgi:multidrug resistance efflux pump